MNRKICTLVITAVLCVSYAAAQSKMILVYTHPNAPTSIAGMQADMFARKVKEYSGGAIVVEVYPSSQLGTLVEQEQLVKSGMVAFTHNTAASMGGLFEDFAVLDTPFIYDNVAHLLKVTNPESTVMKKLNTGILKQSNVRVLSSFYFGTRLLTADRALYKPADLAGLPIRAIPFPIYTAAVEGMGAKAVPVDWSETPISLRTKRVVGQENPANSIAAARLWEVQSHLMMTNHIIAASVVVMNNDVWNRMTPAQQSFIQRAAHEAAEYGTKTTLELEESDLKILADKGMIIIGPKEGLDIAAFKKRTSDVVQSKFGSKWADYYSLIKAIK